MPEKKRTKRVLFHPSIQNFVTEIRNPSEVYIELIEISAMKLFCKNSYWLVVINFFHVKAPSETYNLVLNRCLPLGNFKF